jgi:hypothetical protein
MEADWIAYHRNTKSKQNRILLEFTQTHKVQPLHSYRNNAATFLSLTCSTDSMLQMPALLSLGYVLHTRENFPCCLIFALLWIVHGRIPYSFSRTRFLICCYGKEEISVLPVHVDGSWDIILSTLCFTAVFSRQGNLSLLFQFHFK